MKSDFSRWMVAGAAAVSLHALIAIAIAAYMNWDSGPQVQLSLDVSSVELSLSEDDRHDLPFVSMASMPSEAHRPPEVKDEVAPGNPEMVESLPPDAEAVNLPSPEKSVDKMDAAEVKEEEVKPQPPEPRPASPAMAVAKPAPRQARIDMPPSPRRNIRPDYPKGARMRGEQGDVRLEIAVSADGEVTEVSVIVSSGFPELDEAAVRAAKAARFAPARSDGKPVSARATITLTFKLK